MPADLEGLEYEPDLQQVLRHMLEHEPHNAKDWVQRHPRNLMLMLGWKVERHHAQALKDALAHRQAGWLAPRGSGKSTAFNMVGTWLSIADPDVYTRHGIPYLFPDAPHAIGPHNIRINITSNSADNATTLVWQAKQSLLDERMARMFGNLEGRRWRDQRADTALRTANLRETTFTAMGLGSKVTGGHYDVVMEDDWVTEDNARTELQRQRLVDFWNFTVRPTHEPWSRDLLTGTRYHPMDWYGTQVRTWVDRGTWKHLRRTVALYEGEDGQLRSYWPEVFPVKTLLDIKDEIGEIAFATQYQNVVDIMQGDFFERPWMERFAKWEDLSPEEQAQARTVIALDPAIKAGPRNDYSVFCVLSFVKGKLYVRRIIRGQWTDEQLKARTKLLVKLFKAELVGIEVVGGIEWLADALGRMDLPCRVRKLRPTQTRGKDKVGRASHVRKYFEQGIVHLEEPTPENGISRLVYEMMAFPSASNTPGMDDCVDALVWALILITRLGGRSRTHRLRSRRQI